MRRIHWILVITLTVLAVVSVFEPGFFRFDRRDPMATYQAAVMQANTIHRALDRFYQDCARYPTTDEGIAALWTVPPSLRGKWGPRPYADHDLVTDPWGNPFGYRSSGPDSFEIVSLGADRQPGGDGYDADVEDSPD